MGLGQSIHLDSGEKLATEEVGARDPAGTTVAAGAAAAASRRPTYRDIAALAGISPATVSLVLNRRPSPVHISETTRDAVMAAARQVGYTFDLGARNLRNPQARAAAPQITVAILRPVGMPIGLSGRLMGSATAALAEHAPSSQLVVEEYFPGRLGEHPGLTVASRFHGAILTGLVPDDENFLEATDLPVPVVAFQRRTQRHAWVNVNSALAGYSVTRHLLDRGRRRIAAIGWSSIASRAVDGRLEGYCRALAEMGLESTAHLTKAAELSEAAGALAATRLLAERRPDAILALSDVIAVGVLHAVRRAGLRVPDDVAVAGFDDLSFSPFLAPPLTTVRLPFDAMGRAAVAWLVAAARGQTTGPLHELYDPVLIVREST